MSEESILRVRCPRDIAKPDPNGPHVRVDIGMPTGLDTIVRVLKAAADCACGAKTVFLHEEIDPWKRPDARREGKPW